MYRPFQRIANLHQSTDVLRARRYGVIEMSAGGLIAVHFRPWPKTISRLQVHWQRRWVHEHGTGDCCWLYFNQPWRSSNYLVLQYVLSQRDSNLITLRSGLGILDEIAEIKGSDALLCEVTNERISERLMIRWGWERHCPTWSGRHYIKRFYGAEGKGFDRQRLA